MESSSDPATIGLFEARYLAFHGWLDDQLSGETIGKRTIEAN